MKNWTRKPIDKTRAYYSPWELLRKKLIPVGYKTFKQHLAEGRIRYKMLNKDTRKRISPDEVERYIDSLLK